MYSNVTNMTCILSQLIKINAIIDAKHLEKQLWELRVRHGRNRYRIIYFLYTGQTFILLHGFTKKTGPVPKADMEMAESRRDDYISRRRLGI